MSGCKWNDCTLDSENANQCKDIYDFRESLYDQALLVDKVKQLKWFVMFREDGGWNLQQIASTGYFCSTAQRNNHMVPRWSNRRPRKFRCNFKDRLDFFPTSFLSLYDTRRGKRICHYIKTETSCLPQNCHALAVAQKTNPKITGCIRCCRIGNQWTSIASKK